MTDETTLGALRLLASLIATDIRHGSGLLAIPLGPVEGGPRKRGRPKSIPFAVPIFADREIAQAA